VEANGSFLPTQVSQEAHRNAAWWRRSTDALLDTAARGNAQTWHRRIGDFVRWVDVCRDHPDLCDPDALALFIGEFARVASAVGEASSAGLSVEPALQRAIEFAEIRGQPVVQLYRARAVYFRTRSVESEGREEALDEALRRAEPGSHEWVGVLFDLSEYYVEASRYREAFRVLELVERQYQLPRRLQLGLDVARGVALFTTFQSLRRANVHLRRACEADIDPTADPEAAAWLARALHYRGRIEEANRNYATALRLYLSGLLVQTQLPEDTNAIGFVHLRIAELFAACELRNSAQRHLDEARKLFAYASNTSSGNLQCDLAQAALQANAGRREDARATTAATWKESIRVNYWRGEFLSLCYLLLLDLRALRMRSVAADIGRLVATIRRGELRRNNLLRLASSMPILLSVALHRLSLLTARPRAEEALHPCPCSLHPPPTRTVTT
jgi:tetratricopeptide (TPR) repeat protein